MRAFRSWLFLNRAEKTTILMLIIFFTIGVFWVMSRCQSTPVDPDSSDQTFENGHNQAQELWPLSEGNYWQYQAEGKETGDEVIVTVEQAGDTKIEKDNKQSLEKSNKSDQFNQHENFYVKFDYRTHETIEYYSYDNEGLLWHGLELSAGTYQRQPPQYLVKFPLGEAHQWSWQGELVPLQGEDLDYRGEAKIEQDEPEKVELPVGRKEGIEVRNNMNLEMAGEQLEIEETRVYVPGIGLVKQEVIENGEVQLKKLLTDYQLGNTN